MRITQEADYALRIVTMLAESDFICGAGEIAGRTGVPERFTHKILRKLMQGGLLQSYSGAKGGYSLKRSPSELTMLDVIEMIDGPLAISKCAGDTYICSKNGTCKEQCIYHQIFDRLSSDLAQKLRRLTIAEIINSSTDFSKILNTIT